MCAMTSLHNHGTKLYHRVEYKIKITQIDWPSLALQAFNEKNMGLNISPKLFEICSLI